VKSAFLLAAAAFVLTPVSSAPEAAQRAGKSIRFLSDFLRAQSLAAQQKRTLMAVFYTDWCQSCRQQERVAYRDPRVVSLASRMIAVKINPDRSDFYRQLEDRYRVRSYPTILFLDYRGRKLREVVGATTPERLADVMSAVLRGASAR
jgi:thiol:disulfide interchange protein